MTEHEFADLLGRLDPELVARADAPVPRRHKPGFRIALVAAALAILICAVLAVIPFVPTTLELDYPANGDMDFKNVWIYYTDRDGHQKSEYVRLPYSVQNVFAAWAHLSGLDESAQLLEITSTEGADADRRVVVTLSTALRDHPDSEQLLASLQKTLVRDFGVLGENFTFAFGDQPTNGQKLLFSTNLDSLPLVLKHGSLLEIEVNVTNISNETVENVDPATNLAPMAILRLGTYILICRPPQSTQEVAPSCLAPGERMSAIYTIEILSDAPCGTYDLVLYYGHEYCVIEDAVDIVVNGDSDNPDVLSEYNSFLRVHTPEQYNGYRDIAECNEQCPLDGWHRHDNPYGQL